MANMAEKLYKLTRKQTQLNKSQLDFIRKWAVTCEEICKGSIH